VIGHDTETGGESQADKDDWRKIAGLKVWGWAGAALQKEGFRLSLAKEAKKMRGDPDQIVRLYLADVMPKESVCDTCRATKPLACADSGFRFLL
jgi:hypothetical protein